MREEVRLRKLRKAEASQRHFREASCALPPHRTTSGRSSAGRCIADRRRAPWLGVRRTLARAVRQDEPECLLGRIAISLEGIARQSLLATFSATTTHGNVHVWRRKGQHTPSGPRYIVPHVQAAGSKSAKKSKRVARRVVRLNPINHNVSLQSFSRSPILFYRNPPTRTHVCT